MERKLIKIEEHDNVAVAVESIKRGQTVIAGQTEVTAQEDIPFGHKIALRDIEAEEAVIKYGYAIGHASCPIKKGSWVHSHNLATNLKGMLTYTYEPDIPARPMFPVFHVHFADTSARMETWVYETRFGSSPLYHASIQRYGCWPTWRPGNTGNSVTAFMPIPTMQGVPSSVMILKQHKKSWPALSIIPMQEAYCW